MFFLYCSILFFPYFYIVFQVSMILFGAQTVCDGSQYAPRKTSVCDKRRDCKERLTWMTYWYMSQIGTMSAGARYWSHNISKEHSYLNIVFPSRYLFSWPYFFVPSLLSPSSFLFFASFPLNSMKFSRQVSIVSLLRVNRFPLPAYYDYDCYYQSTLSSFS